VALNTGSLVDTGNEEILDTIRDNSTMEYQQRIPEATQAGVTAVLEALTEYRPLHNQFTDALVNKIGTQIIRDTSWTNPLAPFKLGSLTWGDTIEEVGIGLPKAKTYDANRDYGEKEIWGTEPLRVDTNYHRINRENYYKVSIKDKVLHRAFLQPAGLTDFVAKLLATPYTADAWDEFTLMCRLFPEYERNGGYYKINVPDVAHLDSTPEDARKVARKMRAAAKNLTFPSTRYNAAKLPVFARTEDLYIFTTPEFNAAVDVEALAAAFNLDKMVPYGKVIEIPQELFGITGAQAIMTTKDFFMVKDTLLENTNANNPVSMQQNYFLHHHQIISASRMIPAIMFTTGAGDEQIAISAPVESVSAITVTDIDGATATQIARGAIYQLDAEAVNDGNNDAVRWSISGNTSLHTSVSQTGVLKVATNEASNTIKVRATATWIDPDNTMQDAKYTERTLTVIGTSFPQWPVGAPVSAITVKGVPVSPEFAVGTYSYTVAVDGGTATKSDVVVTGPDSGDVKIGVSGDTITIHAYSAPGDPVYTVTVTAAP
jgi:hypothetical protein